MFWIFHKCSKSLIPSEILISLVNILPACIKQGIFCVYLQTFIAGGSYLSKLKFIIKILYVFVEVAAIETKSLICFGFDSNFQKILVSIFKCFGFSFGRYWFRLVAFFKAISGFGFVTQRCCGYFFIL